MPKHKIAMLTAGGLAPCLSSAVGGLIERYTALAPEAPIIGYIAGYKGLLQGKSIAVTPEVRAHAHVLHAHGGSPLGNSRVKLTNVADCVKRGLVKEGEDPLTVAANQLVKDGITILHTIGGDDTNTTAADLAAYLAKNNYGLTVVGLPKTIDNDVIPIRQTLGAFTAAEQGATFFENVVNEQSTSSRQLVIHEVMGRHSGWLTAATARAWRARLTALDFLPQFNLGRRHKDIDAIYIPELAIDIAAEAKRLKKVMDEKDSVSIFVSEGAGVADIVKEIEARGDKVERDAFGHVRLDTVKVGDWFGKQFGKLIGADKTLVQKSGYFARSAAANAADVELIRQMVEVAVDCGLKGVSGVVGHDEERGDQLRAIEFARIKGGKHFDPKTPWFAEMLREIGQVG
ncbi:MAG: pyrophosphate--fructose-6-phosphate 1-phosphotransferase [Rhizobiales bacterium]|nr:pyrophosphate--fructose-6-phosphate 1-phosphotransferase [Hyphomicrobiales bacterium]MBI3673992.1 pyrophosphate--fructose-6-phosphate 1-phosphotransferase [Hyphomicrobiales bacterium]